MSIYWKWIENKGLGPISIGSNISKYIKSLKVERDEASEDSTGWDTYVVPGNDIYIDVAGEHVVSITAYLEFICDEENIIGMTMTQVEQALGCAADEAGDAVEYDDGDVKIPFEYFDLGLQIWASDGVVTSATCLSYEDK